MKSLHSLVMAAAAFGIVSCSLPFSGPLVIESDTGRQYSASHLDSLRGMASGKRDAEMMRFADAIIAKAGKREVDEYGTIYPGTVKVIRWTHQGQQKYTALRLATWPGQPSAWQGPTPSSGFYGSRLETEILN
jgi:hypothetical protein